MKKQTKRIAKVAGNWSSKEWPLNAKKPHLYLWNFHEAGKCLYTVLMELKVTFRDKPNQKDRVLFVKKYKKPIPSEDIEGLTLGEIFQRVKK